MVPKLWPASEPVDCGVSCSLNLGWSPQMCISSKSLDNADTTVHFEHSCSYWICQSHHKTHVLGNIQTPGLSEAQHRESSLCEKNHWGKSQILVFTLSGGRPQWLSNLVVLKVWFPNQNYQHHLGARYESRISGPTWTDWMWHSAGGGQQSVYFFTESKLTLLTAWHTSEPERWDVEASNTTLFEKLADQDNADSCLRVTILLGSGCQFHL